MVALVLMVAEKPSLALVAPYSTHWSGLEPGLSTSSARSLSRYPGRRSPGISRVSRTRRATAARPTCTSSAAPSAAGQRPSASPRSRATCTTSSSHLSGGRTPCARCLPALLRRLASPVRAACSDALCTRRPPDNHPPISSPAARAACAGRRGMLTHNSSSARRRPRCAH